MAQTVGCRPITAAPGFRAGSFHVGFVVNKVVFDKILSERNGFLLSVSFHRCSILIPVFRTALKRMQSLETFQQFDAFLEIWGHHETKCFKEGACYIMEV
jgi:hypothetical protein